MQVAYCTIKKYFIILNNGLDWTKIFLLVGISQNNVFMTCLLFILCYFSMSILCVYFHIVLTVGLLFILQTMCFCLFCTVSSMFRCILQ